MISSEKKSFGKPRNYRKLETGYETSLKFSEELNTRGLT